MTNTESPKQSQSEKHAIHALALQIGRIARNDGDYNTAVPGLSLHRRSGPTAPLHCIYDLGVGLVTQGRKQVTLGTEVLEYGPGQSMLTTIDLPVISRVKRATTAEPFLGMMLALDARMIAQVASDMDLPPRRDHACRSISIEPLDAPLLDALARLVRLLDEPVMVPKLSALIEQEVIVRLLAGRHGPHLRHVATVGSPSQQVAKAIAWLKQNFAEPLHGDELAGRAHMSPSTFRQHFRSLTGQSPLQYQKQLRLQEARQLMLIKKLDATTAAGTVGYESASQFSREYSRLFGAPPQRDISQMRGSQRL